MSSLNIILQVLGYDDEDATSNPVQAPINWRRTMARLPFENPETRKYPIDPQGTVTVVDGSRSLTIDGTTQFSLGLNRGPGTYRMTHTGGAAPGFRTDRAIDLSGKSLTLVVNPNLTVTATASTGTPFSGVSVGDNVFIPGATTGDSAGPFSPLNQGFWTVLSGGGSSVTIARLPGGYFTGTGETVAITGASQIQAFSSTGVQPGDIVEISAGFATNSLHSYEILTVNPHWIEFNSTAPLGSEAGVAPTAAGVSIYTAAKQFLTIECDQELVVRLNGDTGNLNRTVPVVPGDPKFPSLFLTTGPVWKLVLVNRSSNRANTTVLMAE